MEKSWRKIMSCHDIGHGMNNVLETVIDMYNNNEISKDATLKIANELMKKLENESENLWIKIC